MAEEKKSASERRYGDKGGEKPGKEADKPEKREDGGKPSEGASDKKDADPHADERADMRKRHEKEHRDLHGQHRDAMRDMHARQESEMTSMNARQGAAPDGDQDQMPAGAGGAGEPDGDE